MEKFFTGKTIEEAIDFAAAEFGVAASEIKYEVEEFPKKGFFGLGFSPAKILVKYEKKLEDTIEEYLTGLFGVMGIDGCKATISVDKENENITIQIDGEAAEILTTRQGDAVEAMQLLLALTINRESEDIRYKVTLNVNDYRNQAKERLENLALRIANQVVKTRKRTTLNPMSAFQRRIIHAKLQDEKDITTFSIGDEPNRRVVIAYQGPNATPYQKKKHDDGSFDGDFDNSDKKGGKKPYENKGKRQFDNKNKKYGEKRVHTQEAEAAAVASQPLIDLKAGEKRANK